MSNIDWSIFITMIMFFTGDDVDDGDDVLLS